MNPLRGIGLKVASVSVFTLMAICIKASAPHVPPGEAVFFRSFFAIPVILVWLVWTRDLRHGLDTLYPMGHVWRGLVGTTAMGLGFTALDAAAAARGDRARLRRAAPHRDLRRDVPRRGGPGLPADRGRRSASSG